MVARPLVLALSLALTSAAAAEAPAVLAQPAPATDRAFERVVKKVAAMVESESAYAIAAGYGLQILNVLWEDTGRWEGSSVGPNISDVTIEVEGFRQGKRHRSYLMPVMRHDNFTDRTADVKMDNILIPVGNQAGGPLHLVTLTELLQNPLQYLSAADRGKIKGDSLWAKRDTHALVSAQHAFLPVPKSGQATFWPVIFNYQSTKASPAVLTILVTRQGTSITIIDNARDTVTGGDSWGQRLYFNQGGKKAPLIAERMADVQASGVTANGEAAQTLTDDANVLMLIQVPLKVRAPRYTAGTGTSAGAGGLPPMAVAQDKPGDAGLAAGGPQPARRVGRRHRGARPRRDRGPVHRARRPDDPARRAVPGARDAAVLPGDLERRGVAREREDDGRPDPEGLRQGRLRRLAGRAERRRPPAPDELDRREPARGPRLAHVPRPGRAVQPGAAAAAAGDLTGGVRPPPASRSSAPASVPLAP